MASIPAFGPLYMSSHLRFYIGNTPWKYIIIIMQLNGRDYITCTSLDIPYLIPSKSLLRVFRIVMYTESGTFLKQTPLELKVNYIIYRRVSLLRGNTTSSHTLLSLMAVDVIPTENHAA